MKLFKVHTGLGIDYVVCDNEGEAANLIKEFYDKADYGFRHERIATCVEYIAHASRYPEGNGACDRNIGRLIVKDLTNY